MSTSIKRECVRVQSFYKNPLLASALLLSFFVFLTGCDKTPLLPDTQFVNSYLSEQTYHHCKRYQRMGTVYYNNQHGNYVFFSHPEEVAYTGLKIKGPQGLINFNCMFRRYEYTGQVYHKAIDYQFSPMKVTESFQYPYTTTMKIEFICMDKIYHDNSEYNAGAIWFYNKEKYADFGKLDLQNYFGRIWMPGNDLLLLAKRMQKDTASGKKMVREVPLRYDEESTSWQWQSASGKWLSSATVPKLGEFSNLPMAEKMNSDYNILLGTKVAGTKKILTLDFANYILEHKYENLLRRYLNDEVMFFCPGIKTPFWVNKKQYHASQKLVDIINKVQIEHQKVSPWQTLLALNEHYHALLQVQNILWKKVEKDLNKIFDMLCTTDFIEKEQKKEYLKKFISRLDECTNLRVYPYFFKIKSMCRARLMQLDKDEPKKG